MKLLKDILKCSSPMVKWGLIGVLLGLFIMAISIIVGIIGYGDISDQLLLLGAQFFIVGFSLYEVIPVIIGKPRDDIYRPVGKSTSAKTY
jgi:quinol-cytochrome oxidoreductase complex cytochrome b subunit